jgi:hypothetical protein
MHELTAREIFQETGRRFLHSDGRCASLTTPVPRFTTSGFRLRIATSSSAGLVAVLFLLRANIGPEALYTSRSLTNLSGTLSPTLRVEIVGEAHRTVVGDIFDKIGGSLDAHCPRAVRNRDLGLLEDTHSVPRTKLAVSAQALTLGRNCAGIVNLEANQLQSVAKTPRFDRRLVP